MHFSAIRGEFPYFKISYACNSCQLDGLLENLLRFIVLSKLRQLQWNKEKLAECVKQFLKHTHPGITGAV